MFKFGVIAAAALATVVMPSVAQADSLKDRIKLLADLKNERRNDLIELKTKFHAGDTNLTREEYRARLERLQASLDRLAERIQKLKDKRASA